MMLCVLGQTNLVRKNGPPAGLPVPRRWPRTLGSFLNSENSVELQTLGELLEKREAVPAIDRVPG
jgi:hypothetical protein